MCTDTPVAVVTDSAAGIPEVLRKRYRIEVIPFCVQVGADAFVDGLTIDTERFFQLVRQTDETAVIATAIPPIETFKDIYQRLAKWAKSIVSIHVAGEQSGTCSAAKLAARESPIPVAVVDSETTAMAQGFVVLEAARAALDGLSLDAVANRARAAVPNVEVVALLENVRYAVRGGRLASAARLLGSLLKIQPLIRVSQNKVGLTGQTRRRKAGVAQLIERVVQRAGDAPIHVNVHYAEDEAEGQRVLEALQAQLNCVEAYLNRIPVALGVHAGPGSLGIAYYVEGGPVQETSLVERLPWIR